MATQLPRWAWAQAAVRHDPFGLGVASGDPVHDGVVLWTRVLPPADLAGAHAPWAGPLTVRWELADDAQFRHIVQQGTAMALPELGHSVHVEVAGLRPDRWYHYRFMLGDATSPVGRTRTTPAPDALPGRLPAARDRLLQALAQHPPRNTVLLGGDIHQNYVCNVMAPHGPHAHGAPRILASEFCGTSISSRAGTTQEKVDAIARHNPHVLLARCEERGYGLCDITPTRWTTTLRALRDPLNAGSAAYTLARFVVEDGRPGPQPA
ncbi:PhoD-like phosphatase [Diaphorobacter nitroreducens]|uniref:PhoD-like phosphatase n=2 Tax=Comamonadaceae TaxID=80864 RepID=A0AAX1WZZ0_9BURK|nr:PhoD-like phosphatase [Diaphorobacter nitroreducens]